MENFLEETIAFASKIKETDVYLNYLATKKDLGAHSTLKDQVDEFRRNSFLIQTGHNFGQYNSFEQMVNLKNENDELLSNPVVKAFLEAEFKLTQMIATVMNSLVETIEFDIEFLE